ncbi:MAG: hypothetical protein M1826_000923 [Phylliscum demangeonii]|nr:MAG: hypothetical protein M1826_000923 [Phylliscum demangeonii]
MAPQVPAWKKLGLKLKFAREEVEQVRIQAGAATGNQAEEPKTDGAAEAVAHHGTQEVQEPVQDRTKLLKKGKRGGGEKDVAVHGTQEPQEAVQESAKRQKKRKRQSGEKDVAIHGTQEPQEAVLQSAEQQQNGKRHSGEKDLAIHDTQEPYDAVQGRTEQQMKGKRGSGEKDVAIHGTQEPQEAVQESAKQQRKRKLQSGEKDVANESEHEQTSKKVKKLKKLKKSKKNKRAAGEEASPSGSVKADELLVHEKAGLPKKPKSVAFTADTKKKDGDSVKQLFSEWLAQERAKDPQFDLQSGNGALGSASLRGPRENRKASKKRRKTIGTVDRKDASGSPLTTTSPPNPSLLPTLTYLLQYAHSRTEWKFNKARQTYLLKHLLDFDQMPPKYDPILAEYIAGLQSEGARARVREAMIKVVAEKSDPGEEETGSNDAVARTPDGRRRDGPAGPADDPSTQASKADKIVADKAEDTRLRQIRAQTVLSALSKRDGMGPGTEADRAVSLEEAYLEKFSAPRAGKRKAARERDPRQRATKSSRREEHSVRRARKRKMRTGGVGVVESGGEEGGQASDSSHQA